VIRLVALALLLSGCDLLFQVEHVELLDATVSRPDSALPPWSEPMLISEVSIAGDDPYESDASMTGDGLELFFASDRGKVNELDIYVATRLSTADRFGAPAVVPQLTTNLFEAGAVSADGLTFYMTRTGTTGILMSSRMNRSMTWSAPVPVPELSIVIEPTNPSISPDGLTFVVNAPANNAATDLFIYSRASTSGSWEVPRQLTEIASQQSDGAGTFDGTGLAMVFHTDRELDGSGTSIRKIYETSRPARDEAFGRRNTYSIEELGQGSDPWISPDFRTIVFTRDGDLYMSTR
jgi:hypothetical protein